jgi:MFS transporter, DHA2 family, multidrug resistance protein
MAIVSKLINGSTRLQQHQSYRWLVLANIMVGTFISVLDSTIVNVGRPKIMAAFGASLDKIEWISTAYMLAMAVMLPASGWLADHFGYKRTYFTGLLLFTLGSLLCGLSWDENSLIFFRVIQGAGAGLLSPVGMALVTREFPPEQRGMALGFWGIASAASISLGPLIGGYLVDNWSWQSIFTVNVPIGLAGMLATLIIQKEYKSKDSSSFDSIGFISMALFLTFLLIALSEGNADWNIGGWTSQFSINCYTLSFIGLVVFLFTELTIEKPLIQLRLLKSLSFSGACLVLFIFSLGMYGSTLVGPMYMQGTLGYTAFQSGMVFLPTGIIQGLVSPLAGKIADKFKPLIPALLGMILMALSMYWNSSVSLYTEKPQLMWIAALRGLGMGFIFTPLSAMAFSEITKEKMAQASGVYNVIRQVGGSFGFAIIGTVFIRRDIFHTAILGQTVGVLAKRSAPVYHQLVNSVTLFAKLKCGRPSYSSAIRAYNAALQGQSIINSHMAKQAYVQAINDCYLAIALLTVFGVISLIAIKIYRKLTESRKS